MKLSKSIILIEAIVILTLAILLFSNYNNNKETAHCTKYLNDDGTICLLSPRVYTGLIQPESFILLNFNPIKEDISNYINENHFNISVYILNIKDGASFGIHENKPYQAFSLNKLPLAMAVLKKVERRNLTLDTKIKIQAEDVDSRFGALYANQEKEFTVRELIHYMLSDSDNTAQMALARQVTVGDFQAVSNYLGYYNINPSTNYSALDNKDFIVTPKSVANLFLSLYLSTSLTPEDSSMILFNLANTSSFDIKKYAMLGSDVAVVQKDGDHFINETTNYFHSCGIMYIGDSRILYCVMTEGLDKNKAYESVGTIVNKVYRFVISEKEINKQLYQ